MHAGILWAIIKISVDTRAAQRLCARAIFNLSFDALAQAKMVEMGVARSDRARQTGRQTGWAAQQQQQ